MPKGPVRSCVGCRTKRVPSELLRFVCAATGEVLLDYSGRAPGRGVYVCADIRCVQKVWHPAKLTAFLHGVVTLPAVERVRQDILCWFQKHLGACISMGQKAGAVVSGYTALQQAFGRSRVLCMITAQDIVAQRAVQYASWCTQQHVPSWSFFTKEELGRLVGKSARSAIGIVHPHFCERIRSLLASLERFEASAQA